MSPQFKDKWATGITQSLIKIIDTVERGAVSHPKPFLLVEIWKIITRAVKEFPNAKVRRDH